MALFKKKTLTGLGRTCGLAAKVGPTALSDALSGLDPPLDSNLLVGMRPPMTQQCSGSRTRSR